MKIDCLNALWLNGDIKQIRRFIEQGKDITVYEGEKQETLLSLKKFLPIPIELESGEKTDLPRSCYLKDKYGFDHWSDWCMANWGTEVDLTEVYLNPKLNLYDFNSETPPVKAITAISKLYPGIKFTLEYQHFVYNDDHFADVGELVIKKGNIFRADHYKRKELTICPSCNGTTWRKEG